jgi:hypothetical protein
MVVKERADATERGKVVDNRMLLFRRKMQPILLDSRMLIGKVDEWKEKEERKEGRWRFTVTARTGRSVTKLLPMHAPAGAPTSIFPMTVHAFSISRGMAAKMTGDDRFVPPINTCKI